MDAFLSNTGSILTVAIGLGFVIFIHELGHFLVAKWNGVKVEAFAIGFGPAVVAWRKGIGPRLGSTQAEYARWLADHPDEAENKDAPVGETEYSLRAIPLGGFVKMLGEGGDSTEETSHITDPRAYSNKSVGARMAIISAGVIMNGILGVICFAWAYGRGGLPVIPAIIGAVGAGHPAYEAGLRAGDEVTAIGDRRDVDFLWLKRITAMSGPGEVLNLEVKRKGVAEPVHIEVEPNRQGDSEHPTIGILPPESLDLAPTAYIPPAGLPTDGAEGDRVAALGKSLKVGDRVVAAGLEGAEPTPVKDIFELRGLLARERDKPVVIVVERGADAKAGAEGRASKKSAAGGRFSVTLPPVPFVDLGLRMTMGPVVALRPEGPAARAGFREGDRIVGIEGVEELDPIRLPDLLYGRAGEPVEVKVARSEAGKPEELVTLTVTPEAQSSWTEVPIANEALDVAPIGLAVEVEPRVAAVRPGSPAAAAGIRPGTVVKTLALTVPPLAGGEARTQSINVGADGYSWPAAFAELQVLPRHSIELVIGDGGKTVRLTPEPDPEWMSPMRGLQFLVIQEKLAPLPIGAAVSRGLAETADTINSVYLMFQRLFQGRISTKGLGGPIVIFDMAYQTAQSGMVTFLNFLGMLSLNLAVINFLPVPPLDGGQMVFLIAEKLRGRPVPEKVMNAGMLTGLVFVLGLMAFVFFQDIMRYVWG